MLTKLNNFSPLLLLVAFGALANTTVFAEPANVKQTGTNTTLKEPTPKPADNDNGNSEKNSAKNEKPELSAVMAKRLQLATIDITGVANELKKNIELHMPVTVPECTAGRGEVKLFFTAVKKHLRKATRALGYYDAEFTSGGSIVDGCWKLRLKVNAGRPVKVVAQEIKLIGEGRNEDVFKKIMADLPYKTGDVLNHQRYSEFKTKLSEASQTLGYFNAKFEKRTIRVDPASYQAKVALVLNTGKRFRYGKVAVEQKILSQDAVQKYLIIQTGKPFKAVDLIEQQQVFQRSGYYKTIKIEAQEDQISNNQVPVLITLEAKKRDAYKFKIGFGSDTGPRVSAELHRRWTGSKGQYFKAKAQYSEVLSGVSFQLVNPREDPEDNSLVYNIDWTKDSNDDVVSKSYNIGGKLIKKYPNDWVRSVSVNALIDETKVENEYPTHSKLLLFGVGLEKVKADNLLYPTKGWRMRYSLSAASEYLLSDQNVVQFKAQAKGISKLGEGRLLGRVNFGSTLVNDFYRLPKSLRFFAGGANSVRGYDFESLGERNTNDRVIGGKQLLDLSLEYQHPVRENWSIAAFADTGNAFNDFKDATLKTGVGFGARWRSPVGPVRIDLGFPSDDLKKPKLYLSVGSDL